MTLGLPGAMPIETPTDVGIRLPAGSRLVFNVHYHAAVTGPEVDDLRAMLRAQGATN